MKAEVFAHYKKAVFLLNFNALILHNRPESQINSWSMDFLRGRQTVEPKTLGLLFHHQQTSMLEQQIYLFFGEFMFEGKFSFRPET